MNIFKFYLGTGKLSMCVRYLGGYGMVLFILGFILENIHFGFPFLHDMDILLMTFSPIEMENFIQIIRLPWFCLSCVLYKKDTNSVRVKKIINLGCSFIVCIRALFSCLSLLTGIYFLITGIFSIGVLMIVAGGVWLLFSCL